MARRSLSCVCRSAPHFENPIVDTGDTLCHSSERQKVLPSYVAHGLEQSYPARLGCQSSGFGDLVRSESLQLLSHRGSRRVESCPHARLQLRCRRCHRVPSIRHNVEGADLRPNHPTLRRIDPGTPLVAVAQAMLGPQERLGLTDRSYRSPERLRAPHNYLVNRRLIRGLLREPWFESSRICRNIRQLVVVCQL
jgi:hypothetical protein